MWNFNEFEEAPQVNAEGYIFGAPENVTYCAEPTTAAPNTWRLFAPTSANDYAVDLSSVRWQLSPNDKTCWYHNADIGQVGRAWCDSEGFDSEHFELISERDVPFFEVDDEEFWDAYFESESVASSDIEDPFLVVLEEIRAMNERKRGDYATNEDPWSNFKDSARQIDAPAGTAVEVLIATKQSRLRQLLNREGEPNNESVRDSLLDRAVYSIISLAMYDEGLYDGKSGVLD